MFFKGTYLKAPKPQDGFADLSRRLIAASIDLAGLLLLLNPLTSWLYNLTGLAQAMERYMLEALATRQNNPLVFFRLLASDGLLATFFGIQLLILLLIAVIVIAFWTLKGATPGKMLLGCRIQDRQSSRPPSLKQAIVRFFSYILSGLPLMLGFFMINFTQRRQGLHDKLANTLVVLVKKQPAGPEKI